MPDIIVPLQRPVFPERQRGRYQRTVDGVDLGDLVSAVQHMYGIDGLCVATMLVHHNFNTGGATDVDVTEEAFLTAEFMANPVARDIVIAVIAQVSTSRATPGTINIELYEVSDPTAPIELDLGTGITLTAGQEFSRTQVDGGIPPQRYYILPVNPVVDAPTVAPDRVMEYEPNPGDAWPDGHPRRIEVRIHSVGIRLHTIAVFEYPRESIEETA